MEYAVLTFWLSVIVFGAMGVHRLWTSLVQPKVVNSLLLPGTLVAQLGHILGLLVTGGTVNDAALIKDDDSGEPSAPQETKSRIPVIGPIIIAMLPLVGCGVAICWVASYFSSPILAGLNQQSSITTQALPTSVSLFFDLLRNSLLLVENLIHTIVSAGIGNWRTALFLYLVICLTVRMAPLNGNIKGSIGAILLFGVIAFLFGQISSSAASLMDSAWPLVTFCAAVVLLLLIISLVAKGIVSLVKTFANEGGGR